MGSTNKSSNEELAASSIKKPIFLLTHPRSCSTAFERVFMAARSQLEVCHEPFSDAYYFGPERLAHYWITDQQADSSLQKRKDDGIRKLTYGQVADELDSRIKELAKEGKRLFIKEMAASIMPMHSQKAQIASSLSGHIDRERDATNPTVLPLSQLSKFHFTFLIRHPRSSVPSYYRCTIPPLRELTGFDSFDPEDIGIRQLRELFDFCRSQKIVGPNIAGNSRTCAVTDKPVNKQISTALYDQQQVDICVVDADDLLDNPRALVKVFCDSIGLIYSDSLLDWNDPQIKKEAEETFQKWIGWHIDALQSTELKARTHKKTPKSDEELFAEWTGKYGTEAAEILKKTVNENIEHYEYLKQFALKA